MDRLIPCITIAIITIAFIIFRVIELRNMKCIEEEIIKKVWGSVELKEEAEAKLAEEGETDNKADKVAKVPTTPIEGCENCLKRKEVNNDCPWDGTYNHRDVQGRKIVICNAYKKETIAERTEAEQKGGGNDE